PPSVRAGQTPPFCAPLRPDRLGEEVVARSLGSDAPLSEAVVRHGDDEERKSAATVLGRVAARSDRGGERLRQLLEIDLEVMAQPAMNAALETGHRIGDALARALEARRDFALARRIDSGIPEKTVALGELAVAATRLRLEALRPERDRIDRR